jgi:hypothetical protein
MKKSAILKKSVTLFMAIMLTFAVAAVAFADEPSSSSADNRPAIEQTTPSATSPSATATDNSGTTGVDNGETTIPEDEVPLSKKPYELGWALFNLLATVFTAIIAVFLAVSLIRGRNKGEKQNNNFGLSIFSIIAAILSIVLFAGTEDFSMSMIIVDSYSVAHVSVLAVAILCAALSFKRDVRSTIPR